MTNGYLRTPWLKAAIVYFVIVFSAGFVLGTVRVLLLEPRMGANNAELLEIPVMVAVTWLSAIYLHRRFDLRDRKTTFMAGAAALLILLVAEFGFVLGLRGLTIPDYLATRLNPSGLAYALSLIFFLAAPTLALTTRRKNVPSHQ